MSLSHPHPPPMLVAQVSDFSRGGFLHPWHFWCFYPCGFQRDHATGNTRVASGFRAARPPAGPEPPAVAGLAGDEHADAGLHLLFPHSDPRLHALRPAAPPRGDLLNVRKLKTHKKAPKIENVSYRRRRNLVFVRLILASFITHFLFLYFSQQQNFRGSSHPTSAQ